MHSLFRILISSHPDFRLKAKAVFTGLSAAAYVTVTAGCDSNRPFVFVNTGDKKIQVISVRNGTKSQVLADLEPGQAVSRAMWSIEELEVDDGSGKQLYRWKNEPLSEGKFSDGHSVIFALSDKAPPVPIKASK